MRSTAPRSVGKRYRSVGDAVDGKQEGAVTDAVDGDNASCKTLQPMRWPKLPKGRGGCLLAAQVVKARRMRPEAFADDDNAAAMTTADASVNRNSRARPMQWQPATRAITTLPAPPGPTPIRRRQR